MRLLMSIGAGVVMGFLLFLLMSALISGGQSFDNSKEAGKIMDFVRVKQDDAVNTKVRQKPKPPEPPKEPPPPPKMQVASQNKPPPTPMNIETPNIDISMGAGGGPFLGTWSPGDVGQDGDVIPIVRINPQYPREALMEGIEGWVDLEFTIMEDGTVQDAQVVDSHPRRIFDKDARRAIYRWKFKPRIVDGQPVQRRASQRIEFKMEGG